MNQNGRRRYLIEGLLKERPEYKNMQIPSDAGEQKMLRSYRPREAYKVPAEMRENQWRWTGLYVDYIGFLTNRDRLRELGLYAPETWNELLKPELWEETALADFKNGGRSYGMITSIWQLRGEAKAMEYAASFNSQLPLYTASEWEAIEAVRSGRKTIAVVSLSTALQLERQNRDLFATLVKDGNKNCITGAAILQGANLAEAQSFMDYLLSEHSKDLLASKGYPLLWRVSDYAHDDGRKMMIGDLELAVDDLSWTAGQKSVIIQQWLNAAHGLTADVQDLGFDALCLQLPGNKGKGGVGAALLVGAAVDEQDFHKQILSFFGKTRRTWGALP